MKPHFNPKKYDDVEMFTAVESFADWYSQFVTIIEQRVYSKTFEKLVSYISNFDGELTTRLTEEEKDDQLVLCSQYKYTLMDIAKEIKMHVRDVERKFKIWKAKRYEILRNNLLTEQKNEIKDGFRTKGGFGNITEFTLKNRLLSLYGTEWDRWQTYIDKIEKSYLFITNILEDMENRSNILKNLNNKDKNRY